MTSAARPTTLRSGPVTLEVLAAGAAVRRLLVDDGEGPVDVVLGHADPGTYVGGGGYLGATVGRFTNRLARGRFVLDGSEVVVPTNDGPNALHGGPVGFDARTWSVLEEGPTRATFELTSPDGDQGLPGEVTARVTYEVTDDAVTIEHRATTTRATLLGLTNHAYLNLDGEASGDVLEHHLEVAASTYTPVRPDLLPTGEVAPVADTPFDLRSPRRIGDVLGMASEQLRYHLGLYVRRIDRMIIISGLLAFAVAVAANLFL